MSNRVFKLIGLFLLIFASLFLFQNCSSTMRFSATGEVGESSTYQAPVLRSLTLSPVIHKIENDEPVKVLLVVDDSGTMKNSQENLSRSVEQLGELLKNYDSQVMVVSTTCANCVVATQNETSTANGISTKILRRDFNPSIQKFVMNKNASETEKQQTLASLSSYIIGLGTSGAVTETPLRSIAWALDSQNFFNPGDNAIIYVLTDEDDSESERVAPRQYLKYEKILSTEERTIIVPAGQAPAVVWRREYYEGSYLITYYDSRCGPVDDLGNRDCPDGGESTRRVYNKYTTLSECNSAVRGEDSPSCKFESELKTYILDPDETVTSKCAYFRDKYGAQVKSCSGTTVRVDADEETIGGEVISSEVEYFLGINPDAIQLQTAIAKQLESKFSGNYVLAAQVNIQGQDCTLGQGQSYDVAFSKFATLLPAGRFLRSSICSESALRGEAMRDIAIQLTVNITNNYLLDLDISERILGLYVVMNGVRKQLIQGVDFIHANDVLTLTKLKPNEIDSMHVDIGLKENWKYQESQ